MEPGIVHASCSLARLFASALDSVASLRLLLSMENNEPLCSIQRSRLCLSP